MKPCMLLIAACGCVLAAQAADISTVAAVPRYRARQMLRSDRREAAEKLLRETLDKQAAEIAAFLNK